MSHPAPSVDPALFSAGLPVLGICYGAQLLTQVLGGQVARTGTAEFGRTPLFTRGGLRPHGGLARLERGLDEPLRLDHPGSAPGSR